MASSSQILAEYESLKNTKWYSADDFYNKSFVDEINNAQRNIDSLVKERDAVDSKKQQAEDSYNTFFGNMRNYSSMNDEAEDKFGVTTSMENYEKSRYAVAAMEQQLNTLPSTINRYAGRVMSKAQRDLAYNAAADKWTQTMDTTRRQEDVNKQVWENARRNADIYAQRLYGQQKEDLQAISMQWSDQTSKYQKALDNIRSQEYKKLEWQSKYQRWQWQQAEDRNKRNMALREDALNRYRVQLQYERTAELERQMIEQQKRQDQFDFGNGYTLRRNGNNEAAYFKNGRQITAGQFVEGTGANGANWNMWNTVWNQGVSTKGVGSDTVETFNLVSSTNPKYNYLFTYF